MMMMVISLNAFAILKVRTKASSDINKWVFKSDLKLGNESAFLDWPGVEFYNLNWCGNGESTVSINHRPRNNQLGDIVL